MIKTVYTVLLFTVSLLVVGCQDDYSLSPYFSVKLGATSLYKIEKTTTDGTQETRKGWTNISVKKNGSTTHLTRQSLNRHYRSYLISEDGIFLKEDSPKTITNSGYETNFIMPSTFKNGDTWKNRTYTTALQTSQSPWESTLRPTIAVPVLYRVISINEDILVSGARYKDCVLVEGTGTTKVTLNNYIGNIKVKILSKTWYARNIGLVKTEISELTDSSIIKSGKTHIELLRHSK